jgi:ABC-2 type transport system permease protein
MNLYPVFKKELQSYFSSSIAYIIITIFLVLSGFFFYTDVLNFNIRNIGGGITLTEGVWLYFFQDIRFIFLLIIPLLTMRLFAEEVKLGTIELLFTYPIRDIEILTGKFLASLSLLLFILLLTLSYPISLATIWSPVESGSLLAGYLGLFLLGTSFIACGIFISSLTENQIVAAIATLGVLILFWFLTWNEAIAEPALMNILLRLSLFDRTYNFFRGVIDTKDVIFFIVFILFFLFLTLQSLNSRRWRGLR